VIELDHWRDGGATFDWRGHAIWHRADGDGEPVLAIHGFPTASWDFAAIWPGLCEKYRAVTLDMIGFGFSAKPRGFAYSIMAQADLIEALLARLGITRYRMLAHDYGVTVAQELLARQRAGISAARIAAVCLLNGGLFPETHRARPVQRLLVSPIGPILARLSTYRVFARNMQDIWGATPPTDAELRGMWQLVRANDGLAVTPALLDYMAQRRRNRARWVGALVDSDVPIRLIAGMRDPVSGAHMVARYRELVPDPDVVELADVGHYPQVEAPDRVAAPMHELFARA
jgi:pimeloyl-ACP methyl ester carboxylesterase